VDYLSSDWTANGAVADAKLLKDIVEVSLYGALRNSNVVSYLLV